MTAPLIKGSQRIRFQRDRFNDNPSVIFLTILPVKANALPPSRARRKRFLRFFPKISLQILAKGNEGAPVGAVSERLAKGAERLTDKTQIRFFDERNTREPKNR